MTPIYKITGMLLLLVSTCSFTLTGVAVMYYDGTTVISRTARGI